MQTKVKKSPRPDARQRLLAAAALVFARDGLNGATTRAISREAADNVVTLFSLFRSKERLQAAVVGETFGDRNPLAQDGAAGLHRQPAGRPDALRQPL